MTLPGKIFAVGFAVMVLLASAASALAQTIPVKSGEHEDFSRLVLDFPDTVQWQFGKVEGGYEFRSDRHEAKFALENVFAFIPRDRIRSVADLGDGRLFLAVDCECYADAFDLRDGRVVLDIKDGAPLASARIFNQRLPDLTTETANLTDQNPAATGLASAPLAGASASGIMPTDSRPPMEIRRGLPLLPTQINQPADVPVSPTSPETGQPEQARDHSVPGNLHMTSEMPDTRQPDIAQNGIDRVAQTQRELLDQIGRAAAQGLLEADTSPTDAILAKTTQERISPPETETPPPAPPAPPPEPEEHVLIQTAIDREFSLQGKPETVTDDGLACPQDEYFDIASWGEEPNKGVEFGPYRKALVGEFDIPHPEAAAALAKYYIYLTFGAEAIATLNMYDTDPEQAQYLRILARIMDREIPSNGQILASFAACDSQVALWALLAVEHVDPLQEINAPAVAATFSALPVHLRRYLAPPLIKRLLEVDETDLATMIRNAVERVQSQGEPEALLVEAQMQMSEGDTRGAVSALEQLAFGNSDHAPKALLQLIRYKLKNGIEITEREIATAASFAFEHRGTELGRALNTAEIDALAETARFPEAFEKLQESETRGEIPPQDRDRVLSAIFLNLANKASDAQFLRFAVTQATQAQLSREARMAVASRLADLHFNKEARLVLSQSPELPNTQERLLFARIAVDEKKYNVALGYLAGLETPDALRLRAQALAGQQEMEAAIQTYSQAGDNQEALQLAWREGDWKLVSRLDDDVLAAASRLRQTSFAPPPEQTPQKPVLGMDADLVARSEQTREVITELLRRFPMK